MRYPDDKVEKGDPYPYQEMWRRSFAPSQWFRTGDPPHGGGSTPMSNGGYEEGPVMWVYRRDYQAGGHEQWVVGFYDPRGEWHPDSSHEVREMAAARVRWLNGGNSQ